MGAPSLAGLVKEMAQALEGVVEEMVQVLKTRVFPRIDKQDEEIAALRSRLEALEGKEGL